MCPLPNSHIEILSPCPYMMVFGGGAFGSLFGHDDGALMKGVRTLIGESSLSSSVHEDTARNLLSMN